MANEKGKNRPCHPAGAEALRRFREAKGLNNAEIGRIIGMDSRGLTVVDQGERTYTPTLVRLYALTQDEAFKPEGDKEAEAYKKLLNDMPPSLQAYLEDGTVPPPPERKHRKQPLLLEDELLLDEKDVQVEEELEQVLLLFDSLIRRMRRLTCIEDKMERKKVRARLRARINTLYTLVGAVQATSQTEAAQAIRQLQSQLKQLATDLQANPGRKGK